MNRRIFIIGLAILLLTSCVQPATYQQAYIDLLSQYRTETVYLEAEEGWIYMGIIQIF
ncbi:MAG: hypothetical protein FWB98_02420 [Defluviitaleaceae bacterium]|nr:hypothetical protein [Defluviitaleaceae bacterium]